MCETLMPDVMAPEAHQNGRSYVHELSVLTFDSLRKNLHAGQLHSGLHKTVKIGVWALVQGWALARDNMVIGLIKNTGIGTMAN